MGADYIVSRKDALVDTKDELVFLKRTQTYEMRPQKMRVTIRYMYCHFPMLLRDQEYQKVIVTKNGRCITVSAYKHAERRYAPLPFETDEPKLVRLETFDSAEKLCAYLSAKCRLGADRAKSAVYDLFNV